MLRVFIFISFLGLVSCGGLFQWGQDKAKVRTRQVASVSMQHLVIEDKEDLSEIIDEKLHSLHSYYLLGQKNLLAFDEEIKHRSAAELYASTAYLNLLAVRTQTDEIEQELALFAKETGKGKLIVERIQLLSEKSALHAGAMENLLERLRGPSAVSRKKITQKDIELEWAQQEDSQEFLVFEKNIEHLSHMLDVGPSGSAKKFRPSIDEAGNVSGSEFPAKVWSLTFNGESSGTSDILKGLRQKGLEATFFLLGSDLRSAPDIRAMGHEIGSHSWSHKELTRVGGLTLDKEIGRAVSALRKAGKVEFFRLPYGAGVGTAHIRQKIADLGLLHASWSIDTLDWMPQTSSQITERTLALMGKGRRDAGILMFHDIHPRSAEASLIIMNHLKKDGRRVCTLGEIVSQMNEGADTVCPSN